MKSRTSANRNRQAGQTILLVALAMFALIAMAALAIDVVTMYVARSEAQRSADAAALAGAKVFVTSGYTSYPSGFANTSALCNGSTGVADLAARASTTKNQIDGVTPTVVTSCDFTVNTNPQFTVQVSRSDLPTFFARIWGVSSTQVSATATAEAYNPSGSGGTRGAAIIQASGVKPFLVPNCTPSDLPTANANCSSGGFFIDPVNGNVANNGAFIGTTLTLDLPTQPGSLTSGGPTGNQPAPQGINGTYFFPLDIPINPPSANPPPPAACPSSGRPSCNLVGQGIYFDNLACYNPFQFTCGQVVGGATSVPVDTRVSIGGNSLGQLQSRVDQGTQCLIHANGAGLNQGQDIFPSSFTPGQTLLIQPGANNPDLPLASASNISRSDSIIAVPLFDGRNLCAGANSSSPACNYTAPIIGFLQLGITQDRPTGVNGTVGAIILNASGCNSSLTGTTAISGGDVAPIPVRLVSRSGG